MWPHRDQHLISDFSNSLKSLTQFLSDTQKLVSAHGGEVQSGLVTARESKTLNDL